MRCACSASDATENDAANAENDGYDAENDADAAGINDDRLQLSQKKEGRPIRSACSASDAAENDADAAEDDGDDAESYADGADLDDKGLVQELLQKTMIISKGKVHLLKKKQKPNSLPLYHQNQDQHLLRLISFIFSSIKG